MKKISYLKFTEKELKILVEVLKGKTNKEISENFFVSPQTIKAHVKNILNKTSTHHRTELISKIFSTLLEIDLNSETFYNTIKNL